MLKFKAFSELYKTDFDLTNTFAIRQKWTPGSLFIMDHPRKSNGIIYLNGCAGRYTDKYKNIIEAPQKSLIFLPADSEYTVLNTQSDLAFPDAYLIEFNMISDGEKIIISDVPFMIEDFNHFELATIMEKIVSSYEAAVKSPSAVKGGIYNLISLLSKENLITKNDKFASIRQGINLLEKNILSDISIKEISDTCNISSGHFRRVFKEYSGKSPMQYRLEIKINNAKRMLSDSNVSIDKIAEALNFESTPYFCKIFKNKTGFTPGQYRKSIQKGE